jgi:diguanylate cyclase (GGDEF)-like protein
MDPHASGTRTDPRPPSRRDPEGLWDWNLVSDRIHFSPDWLALVGCHDHEVGDSPDDWLRRVHRDDRPALQHDLDALRNGDATNFELRYRLRHNDGRYRWMRSQGTIVRNDRGEAVRLSGAQEDVTVETATDETTGLPNRLLLIEHLAQAIKQARRHPTYHFALLVIDLGRPPGPTLTTRTTSDPVLNTAARRLETCLRSPKGSPEHRRHDLVSRLDGDQFAVLLDGVNDLSHATGVAEHILSEVRKPYQSGTREIRVSPSIGLTLSATRYEHPEEPLRDAETALHRARVLGGSHCELFDATVLKSEESETALERELELALQREEFALLYQPVISLASNRVAGFEALVRWRHPQLGVVSPLDFIPLAERTGLIVPLSEWILEHACRQLQAWQDHRPESADIWVSVNLSAVQLRDAAFVERIEAVLTRGGFDARRLTVELTEGVAMENPVAVTTALMRLRALGVRISLDDFGTGYSSLAYLRQFPVDALKIDQSFVRRLGTDKNTTAIVTSIVAMARELGLSVIAEGVETALQLEALRSLDCDAVQGYLYAKPLDADAAGRYLETEPAPANAMNGSHETEGSGRDGSNVSDPLPLQPWLAQWLLWLGQRAVVATAVVGVLFVAGVSAVVYGVSRFSPADLPAVTPTLAWPATPYESDPRFSSDNGSRVLPGGAGVTSGRATSAAAAGAADKPAMTAPLTPPITSSAAPPTARPTVATATTAFDVEHLHRFGRCDGKLTISAAGVAFDVSGKERGDGFSLHHGEFVHSIDGATLVIRSANKVYRFTLPDGAPNGAPGKRGDALIAQIADTIARSRPR